VDAETARQVATAAEQVGTDRMRPIFDALAGQISYEQLAIVIECLRNREKVAANPDLA
jgi:uncharacterized protein YpbB